MELVSYYHIYDEVSAKVGSDYRTSHDLVVVIGSACLLNP